MAVEIPAGIDKSARSVFVGNIPYEATEEKLKDIFSEVGPVTSFKLVYDRENGKPKGYGFCEYKDADMALSAMRNLNGYEIGGRSLRVDNACTEKSRMELVVQPEESPYGEPCHPEKAAETIANLVASLPPEQMFEVMKQMKACIQNNPQEAKRMLSQNSQLTYALLQILVVMRAIDPEMAVTVLHKAPPPPPQFQNTNGPHRGPSMGSFPPGPMNMLPQGNLGGRMHQGMPPGDPFGGGGAGGGMDVGGRVGGFHNEQRPFDHRDRDFGGSMRDPRDRERDHFRDPRSRGSRDRGERNRDRDRERDRDRDRERERERERERDRDRDRGRPAPFGDAGSARTNFPPMNEADPEKAQLIMQVLQLTDQQIALLPADQRQSIMDLKNQMHPK